MSVYTTCSGRETTPPDRQGSLGWSTGFARSLLASVYPFSDKKSTTFENKQLLVYLAVAVSVSFRFILRIALTLSLSQLSVGSSDSF